MGYSPWGQKSQTQLNDQHFDLLLEMSTLDSQLLVNIDKTARNISMNFKSLTSPAPFLPPSLLPFVEIFSFSLTLTDKSESSLAVQWL